MIYVLFFLILICSSFARSAPSSSISDFNKRNSKPRHVGYKCLSSQVNIRDIRSTMKGACDHIRKRKQKKGFSLFLFDLFGGPISVKPFPETVKFGFPKDAQMDAVPETALFMHSFNFVVFSPSKCQFLGMVREKADPDETSYMSCKKATWPLNWFEVMDPRSLEGYGADELEK
ncbi:BgtE-6035 [Blumeria graminis f. sp. tritici]|uniref:BgtE-6035 n=2 Tax=Blumeria graminis f. sp. tritici TaxID=62690 RepID=A0A381LJA7_BLUGR|nr:putative secreted effector protein [Blumeria graminis f. sp. tritici 96224]VDB92820.1 BgtE-6035 [Blumeria graminis f. sp. tritici]